MGQPPADRVTVVRGCDCPRRGRTQVKPVAGITPACRCTCRSQRELCVRSRTQGRNHTRARSRGPPACMPPSPHAPSTPRPANPVRAPPVHARIRAPPALPRPAPPPRPSRLLLSAARHLLRGSGGSCGATRRDLGELLAQNLRDTGPRHTLSQQLVVAHRPLPLPLLLLSPAPSPPVSARAARHQLWQGAPPPGDGPRQYSARAARTRVCSACHAAVVMGRSSVRSYRAPIRTAC